MREAVCKKESDVNLSSLKKRSLPLYQEALAAPLENQLYLSANAKTGVSVNFPIIGTCQPTKGCAEYCYAGSGMLQFPGPLKAQMRNLRLAKHLATASQVEVDFAADALYHGVRSNGQDWLRWNGVGDLTKGSIRVIESLAKNHKDLKQWVFSRLPAMVKLLPDSSSLAIMVSLDGTEDPKRAKALIAGRKQFKRAKYRLAYARMRETEEAPRWAFVVFNEHRGGRRYNDGLDPRTCPATVPDGVSHEGICDSCRRCFQ